MAAGREKSVGSRGRERERRKERERERELKKKHGKLFQYRR